jgi:hypothetical protein
LFEAHHKLQKGRDHLAYYQLLKYVENTDLGRTFTLLIQAKQIDQAMGYLKHYATDLALKIKFEIEKKAELEFIEEIEQLRLDCCTLMHETLEEVILKANNTKPHESQFDGINKFR